MSAAFKCDWCREYFEDGFKGSIQKILGQGNKRFDVNLKVSKSPHICKKCWPKFLKLLFSELKATYEPQVINQTHPEVRKTSAKGA